MAIMTETNREKLARLFGTQRPDKQVRISIYMPTHRLSPDRDTDPIRFKNLLTEVEQKLARMYPKREWEKPLAALHSLVDQTAFWMYATDGLAVFATGDELETFHLQYSPDPVVLVGERFHVITLLAYLERLDEAILVEIGRDRVSLYQVNRYDHEPLITDEVETNFHNVFDDFNPYAHLSGGGAGTGVLHAYRTASDEMQRDRGKYFRYLADSFSAMHKKEGKPILLAGTPATLAEFRKVARGDFYMKNQIEKPIDSYEPKALQRVIADALEPLYRETLDKLHQRLATARENDKLVTRADKIEAMAAEGRIDDLVIDLARLRPDDITLDRAVQEAMAQGTRITVLQDKDHELESLYSAILRY